MEYRLEDIGHSKYNGDVSVADTAGLLFEVKKYLKSRFIQLETVDGGRTYAVIAGLYRVGTCHRVFKEPAEIVPLRRIA